MTSSMEFYLLGRTCLHLRDIHDTDNDTKLDTKLDELGIRILHYFFIFLNIINDSKSNVLECFLNSFEITNLVKEKLERLAF